MPLTGTELLDVLASEIESSTGCTDPGSVCLAVAAATEVLGAKPEEIHVLVSPNLYKNGVSVGIPGTGRVGLPLAAALGALLHDPGRGLAILSDVTDAVVRQAEQIVSDDRVHVAYGQAPDPLYVKATVTRGQDKAYAVIMGDYSRITEVVRNGETLIRRSVVSSASAYPLKQYTVKSLYDLILSMEPEAFRFLLENARRNKDAALQDLQSSSLPLGRHFQQCMTPDLTDSLAVSSAVQAYTAAAGEARMGGLNVAIMAIAGSGNHGITNFVGVLSAAEALHATEEQVMTALAISSTLTVYIKAYIKRMTAFCGCGVAAATGMAAAVTWLLGGSYEDSVHAMQTVLGTIGGMFCDGAKLSCAYKLSTAASFAVQASYLALDGCYLPEGVGIIAHTIEQTFANVGRLNDPGMLATDRELVQIIAKNQQCAAAPVQETGKE